MHGQGVTRLVGPRAQGTPYAWPREDVPLTTLTRGSCKTCGFREERLVPFIPVQAASTPAHLGARFPLAWHPQ